MHNMENVKFLNHANISTLKFWTTQILMSRQKYIDPLCILFFRNIPLRGNSVWIFFISSDQLEFYNYVLKLWFKFQLKHFNNTVLKIWNVYTYANHTYSFTNCLQIFLTWYEAGTYIWCTLWQMKLVGDFYNLVTWLFLKIYSGL